MILDARAAVNIGERLLNGEDCRVGLSGFEPADFRRFCQPGFCLIDQALFGVFDGWSWRERMRNSACAAPMTAHDRTWVHDRSRHPGQLQLLITKIEEISFSAELRFPTGAEVTALIPRYGS